MTKPVRGRLDVAHQEHAVQQAADKDIHGSAPIHTRLLSRGEISALMRRDDLKASGSIFLRLAFHLFFVTAAIGAIETGYVLLGCFLLLPHLAAYSFLGWAGIGHELFHRSVFSSRRLNHVLFVFFSILTWSNYAYFQKSHPKHHRSTLHPDDPEGEIAARLPPLDLFFLLTFDLPSFARRLAMLFRNAFGIVPNLGRGAYLFPDRSAARQSLFSAARAILAFHFVTAAIFILSGNYWLIVAVNLAPFFLTFFNRSLAISQHFALSPMQDGDFFSSSRTIILHPIVAFFYANMNYHTEHHFYPGIPYYRLKEVHRLFRSRHAFPNLFFSYIDFLKFISRSGVFSRGTLQRSAG